MSYVQGTQVLITMTFKDPDTAALIDPPDVQVFVAVPPSQSKPAQPTYALSSSTVQKLSTGVYRAGIDTTPSTGDWTYWAGCTGPLAVWKKRTLRVRA